MIQPVYALLAQVKWETKNRVSTESSQLILSNLSRFLYHNANALGASGGVMVSKLD